MLSPEKYNLKTGLALFMPIKSQVKGYPFEVLIDAGEVNRAILCDQICSLDWKARKAKKFTHVSERLLEEALAKFKVLL